MNIYRLHFVGRNKRSKGYSFHPTAFSATAAKGDAPKGTVEVEQDVIDAQLYKEGVMDLLRIYVRQRILSNEGRMCRVYLQDGEGVYRHVCRRIQIAPASSLANRVEVRGKERKYKMPALETLMEDFFDGRKRGFVPKGSHSL